MDGSGLISAVVFELERAGIDLHALAIGWARAAPIVALVPAFGLKALPRPVRAVMGLVLAACIAPSISVRPSSGAWGWSLLSGVAQGLPIAIAAAVPLWAATMTGGAIDAVRSAGDQLSMPTVEGRPTVFGIPMALLASTIFLTTGGPMRVASALISPATAPKLAVLRATFDLAAGIQIAVSVAAPVLAASVVVEVSTALLARAASPAQIQALLFPLRSFAVLAVASLTMDRMVRVIAMWVQARP